MRKSPFVVLAFALFGTAIAGCSSLPDVKSQEYARLKNDRTFEYDFPTVWKAIEKALKDHVIVDRDPSKVDELELRKLEERTLETDWAYSQSRDKYQEYEVNGFPRKKYLQLRVRYTVTARAVVGGVNVTVEPEEEIERLKTDGSSAGYSSVDQPDSSRPNELLEKIQLAILSAAP